MMQRIFSRCYSTSVLWHSLHIKSLPYKLFAYYVTNNIIAIFTNIIFAVVSALARYAGSSSTTKNSTVPLGFFDDAVFDVLNVYY